METQQARLRSAAGFLSLTAFGALLLSGCLASPEAQQDVAAAFTPTLPTPVDLPLPNPAIGCYADRYRQPAASVTKSVDLLFVIDSSSSLNDELRLVADGIDAFIQALPADVDYRIASMLAHGPGSARSGKLFSKARTGVATVLRSDLLDPATLRANFRHDLMNVVTENDTDGGEIGMVSLTRALDDDRLAESRALGFFREDAALAVIFISDENDICAEYPSGVTPVPDPQGAEARSKVAYCVRDAPARMVDGVMIAPSYRETITAESIVKKLQDLQAGRPLVLSAIAYTNPATVPGGGENEYGYGWLDMVKLASGVEVEMTDASYTNGLNRIGALTTVKLSLHQEFALTRREIDIATIETRVDGETVGHTYVPELNQVLLSELGSAESTIDVLYCDPRPEPEPSPSPTSSGVAGVDPICQAGEFLPKSVLKVGLSIDPAEGSLATISSGLAALGATPTYYTDSEVAQGGPAQDGVSVLVVSRKVVVGAVDAAYVQGVRAFITQGGSVMAEYDATALFFGDHLGINPAYVGRFDTGLELFSGNVAGGGLLLPISFSSAFVIDTLHPVMLGVPTTLETGPRAAFAITDYSSEWLKPLATFSASGSTGSIPAGTFPAALVGRCGQGRLALFPMNYFQILSHAGVGTMVRNAFEWLIGN